ncbi:MAG: DNA-binding response regulator [Bacteroidetes bacterium]|nr:MAG: DNA-binding response regulator [Bacteroidota bacterium]
MSARILLVDDEPDILDFLSYNLKKEGYEVSTAGNGMEALEAAFATTPDLILLDLMMPELDGIETCIQLRKNKILAATVIAFLTARAEDFSQINGLEAGADDYITKPIKPKVLISKIKALLRRDKSSTSPTIVDKNASVIVDKERFVAIVEGKDVNLPKKEFLLLELLCTRPGKVFDRNFILEQVWGTEVVVGDRTIDVHIRKLREKIGEQRIQTVKGVGYKLVVK